MAKIKKNNKHNRRQAEQKKRIKKQTNLSKVLNYSKNQEEIRWAYFNKLSHGEISSNVSKVASNPYFSYAVNLTSNGNLKNIYSYLTTDTDLLKNISWMIGIIIHHKIKLNKFIELEDILTKTILDEEYDKSILILNEIDLECGLSTWSMSARGTILKLAGRHKESQEFLTEICTKSGENGFSKAICRHMVNRYDDTSMHISSSIALRKQIMRMIKDQLQSFLMYKIVPRDFSSNYKINYEHVFNIEKDSSIIDIFKLVINLMSTAIDSYGSEMWIAAKLAADKLTEHFSYYVLDGHSLHYGFIPEWKHEKFNYDLIDLYSNGKYNEVYDIAKENSDKYFNFTAFEVIAKSSARIGRNPFNGYKGYLLSELVGIFLKNDEYYKSLTSLFSICHAFSEIPWFKELHILISRESSFTDEKSYDHMMILSSAYSQVNSPRKSVYIPKNLRKDFFDSCKRDIGSSLSVNLYEVLENEDASAFNDKIFLSLDEERFLKYKSKLLVKIGLIDEAIPILEELVRCKDHIVAYESMRLLVDSYIDTCQTEKALDLFVNSALSNKNVINRINTRRLCGVTKKLINKSISICLPIALSLHSRFIDSDFNSALRYSFEKFLLNIGTKNPLEIINKIDFSERDKIYYFLEHVCTQDIMKLSLLFDNKKEIEDCRISVCSYLIGENVSKELLVDEIKQITREQVIRKAVTQVDQSRIHADLSSFRDSRSQVFQNVFGHYLELKINDYSSYPDEIAFEDLHNALSPALSIDQYKSIHVLDIALNEKNDTFHRLILMLRDEFTFGDKGLNSYLSTRIRHGVLPSTILACAAQEGLTSALSIGSTVAECIECLGKRERSLVEKALKKFATNYEKIISEINDEWLQIVSLDQDIKNLQKGGSKDKALFNYSTTALETYALQKILPDENYESFIRIISDWLWNKTEENLKTVKDKILITARDNFTECYSDLSESINMYVSNKFHVKSFHDAINRSKGSLYVALTQVASWFTRSEANMIKEFEIGVAVDIASRPANINVKNDIKEDVFLFTGKYLNSFVDILYILFENAATKSNLSKDSLAVDVSLALDSNGYLMLCVSNNCKEISDIDESNRKLDYYRDAYGDEILIRKVVQQEGGTGIFKIWKILSKDIEIRHEIVFGYETKTNFSFKIIMLDPSGVLAV